MNQVVTFTGFSTKTGENDSGGWTLYLFETAGGMKYQTFDDDLGNKAATLINQAAEIDYETKERTLRATDDRPAKTVTNFILKSVKVATGIVPETPESVNAPASVNASPQDEFRRSKQEMRRTESVKAAATILASPNWKGGLTLDELAILADGIAALIESGTTAEEAVRF